MPTPLSNINEGSTRDRIIDLFSDPANRGDESDPLVWSAAEITKTIGSTPTTVMHALKSMLDNGGQLGDCGLLQCVVSGKGKGWYVTDKKK